MRWTRRWPPPAVTGLTAGLAGVALVTWLIDVVGDDVNELSLTVCYPLLVLVVSGLSGVWPGLATAVASAMAVNWFFIAPVHTLTVNDGRDWVSLGVLAATAVITGHLAAGFRRQRAEADERRRDAELLEEMAAAALGAVGAGPPGAAVEEAAARALGVEWCRIELGGDRVAPGATVALQPTAAGFAVPMAGGGRPLGLLVVGPAREGAERAPPARQRHGEPRR